MLTGWGIFNLIATKLLLPETLTANKGSSTLGQGYWSEMTIATRSILTHKDSVSLILIMTLLFSAPSSMLSNIAFLLQGYGLSPMTTSLLIGSIPCMMILAGAVVALFGKSPKCIMTFGMILLFGAGVIGVGVGTPYTHSSDHWYMLMLPLYLMVLAQSLIIPPGMALYLQPWGDKAGFASGVMSFSKTCFPTFVAFFSTSVTDNYSTSGFLYFIAVILFLANAVFCVMPPFSDHGTSSLSHGTKKEEKFVIESVEYEKLPTVSDGDWLLDDEV
jgi:hypothetical protein